MRRCKVSELVIDLSIYPRSVIDDQHVGYMVRAKEGGAEFPPIVIDKKTKQVIDGVHRCKMTTTTEGEGATIECVEKTYKNDAERFLDAMRFNAGHGRTLTTHDRARCVIVAGRFHISDKALADVLHVNPDWIGELRADRTAKSNGIHVPLKRTIRHMAGKHLTKAQVVANKSLSGMNPAFYANQLLLLLRNDLIDKSDDRLLETLRKLHEELNGLLVV